MTSELPIVLAVAGEDAGHFEAVSTLTDRVLRERVDWLADQLEHCRTWHPAAVDRPYFSLRYADREARALGLRIHGHFGGAAGLPDARSARAQLLLWKLLHDADTRLDVAVIARDLDHRDERLKGLLQAIADAPWPFTVLVAWFQPEVEAWFLGGYQPRTPLELAELTAQRRTLGFCPVEQAHRLLSTRDDSAKDAKRVCGSLTANDHQRRADCLQVDLSTLRSHGASTGMRDFLAQLESRLVPLFLGSKR